MKLPVEFLLGKADSSEISMRVALLRLVICCTLIINQPWAKCGLFAAAALWPVFCGLTVALSLRNFCNEGLQNPCQHLPRRAPHADMSDSVKQIENNDSFSPGIHCNIVRQMMKSLISVYAQLEKYSLGFYDQNTHVLPFQNLIPGR